ncbi:hypothetical protein [Streptomyces puniciscabiei]|uniref:hypothetical protein n=1 Tax=Streptomyces puniciscabiei TaxID=164348 RepID=UPI0006EB8AF1|nr:hypothetical protein [Streptomyces puniciscabiei]
MIRHGRCLQEPYADAWFGGICAAPCLTVSGAVVTADCEQAGDLAERIAGDGLDVRLAAEENKG